MSHWNYIVLYTNHGTMVINEYKTAKHYKRLEEQRRLASERSVSPSEDPEVRARAKAEIASSKGRTRDTKKKGTEEYDEYAAERRGKLSPDLFAVLKRSSTEEPRAWVFVDCAGQPYQDASFNKMVSLELAGAFGGKAMSVNLIRHAATIWLDEHHRHDAAILRYYRYWMMHSKAMQGEYVLAHNMPGKQNE
jgi:hypothetical protein